MTRTEYPLTVRFVLTDAWVENVLMLDSEASGDDVEWNKTEKLYHCWEAGEPVQPVTYGGIARAVQRILAHETSVDDPEMIARLLTALTDDGDSMTTGLADRIVQVAAYGDHKYPPLSYPDLRI